MCVYWGSNPAVYNDVEQDGCMVQGFVVQNMVDDGNIQAELEILLLSLRYAGACLDSVDDHCTFDFDRPPDL